MILASVIIVIVLILLLVIMYAQYHIWYAITVNSKQRSTDYIIVINYLYVPRYDIIIVKLLELRYPYDITMFSPALVTRRRRM